MGTEVQSKMYLPGPGYYTIRDLDDNAVNGNWNLHHESRASNSGQYYDMFLTSPSIEGYSGYGKQQMRQTILNHEVTFKHQLHELHRLYRRQRDLMNEVQCEKLYENPIPVGISQANRFSSRILSEDEKSVSHITNIPTVDFTCRRPSTIGTVSIQSPLSPMKGNIKLSGSVPTQTGVRSEDCISFESRCKKLQRRLFDLEVPADKYIDNEEEQLPERVFGVARMESDPLNIKREVARSRDVNWFLGNVVNTDCNGHSSSSNARLWNHGLTDLNEPIQVGEASSSASIDILGNINCSKGEVRRNDSSVISNSNIQLLSKEFSQNLHNRRDGGLCLNNLPSENERRRKELSSYNSESEKTSGNNSSIHGDSHPGRSCALLESLQIEPRKAHEPFKLPPCDRSKAELQRRRTIFGVDISERDNNQLVLPSHTPGPHSLDLQSFGSSLAFSSEKLANNSIQNLVSVHKGSRFDYSASSLNMNHMLGGGSSQLIPSCSGELSYQNGICLNSPSDSKKSRFCCPSTGFDYESGISSSNLSSEQFEQHGSMKYGKGSGFMNEKSPKNIDVDEVSINKVQNKLIFQNLASINGQSKPEKLQGGLPWLTKPTCSAETSKEKESSDKMQVGFFQSCSHLFANKTEMGNGISQNIIQDSSSATFSHIAEQKRTKINDRPSIGKILGVPIFDTPPSPKPSYLSSITDDNTRKVGSLNSNSALDSVTVKSREQLKGEDLVIEKELNNCITGIRHQIDLNMCLNEEEAPSTPSSSTFNVKIAAEIDLEAPVVLETEEGTPCKGESLESQKGLFESLQDDLGVSHEGIVRIAAEAIVAISSYCMPNPSDDTICPQSQAPPSDSLHWFADMITSYMGDLETDVEAVSTGNNVASCEKVIPQIDYFEFMTLKLTETKVEEYYHKPEAPENQKDEETLFKRPRRGQARRGRQRKDFQRDILPGLASLSRHEVTEDLQTIEGIIRTTGGTWQSSLTKRNAARGSSARGRRRSGGSALIPTVSTVCPPPIQEANPNESVLEERSLTGWGKRTRRPPRQRYPIVNPPLLVK